MGGEQIIVFMLVFGLIGTAIGYATRVSHGHPFWVSMITAILLAHTATLIMDPANTFRMFLMSTLIYFVAFTPMIWLFGKVHARFTRRPFTHRERFSHHPFCPQCGYDLYQSPNPTCPECGRPNDVAQR